MQSVQRTEMLNLGRGLSIIEIMFRFIFNLCCD